MNRAYATDYRDPRWLRLRKQILKRTPVCERCRLVPPTVAHHPFYRWGARAWEYQAHELEALCERCHTEHHQATPTFFEVWNRAPAPTHHRRRHACRRSNSKQLELPLSFYGPMR